MDPMNMRRLVYFVLCAALCAGASACAKHAPEKGGEAAGESDKEPFGRMSVEQLEARMADAKAGKIKLAVFDNNQHERFDKGHIPGARWVDFHNVTAGDLPPEKDATLVFYCANEH